MKPFTFVVVFLSLIHLFECSTKPRKIAHLKGDILIGALFSVHHQPKQQKAYTLTCGEIREHYGIQRVEAAMLALKEINNNQNLLPNITLGVEIRDSCWYSSIALQQSIEFIRDAIAAPENSSIEADKCIPSSRRTLKNLVGVVGPGSSAVTIQVQNLLQLFGIPQVGYSATSMDLSDKGRFGYFLRVVPSDYYQAQVLVDILQYYNWSYVLAVHTDGNYGDSGMTAFREMSENNNICIATEDSVLSNAEDEAFDEVIRNLRQHDRARVVVCFCEGMTVRKLLKAAYRQNATSRFLFLGSDGWADRPDVVEGIEEAAVGGLSIKIHSAYVSHFDEYYFKLHPETNKHNPWFKEFWQWRFNCSLHDAGEEAKKGVDPCTGKENLNQKYRQDPKMAFVMKAIYTMAFGLHNMHRDICKGVPGLCKDFLPINGSLFREYLMNVTFSYVNESVSFDSRGDPPGRYLIVNYKRLPDGSFDYVPVGSWNNGSLSVDQSLVYFSGGTDGSLPISICSDPCRQGQKKSYIEGGKHAQMCCWACSDCDWNEFLANETTCEECPRGYRPNFNKTACDMIPVEFLSLKDGKSIGALCLAGLGMVITIFAMFVFIRHNDTPVVKASTRELSYIILAGMMISHITSVPLLARPSGFSCALSRILPGLSLSMIYAALLTKTNRIARIMEGDKKIVTKKQRFISTSSQVVITFVLIGMEVSIISFMLIAEPPNAEFFYPNSYIGPVVLLCDISTPGVVMPMMWDFILVLMCTIYAVKTRNLPENFNEAKYIGFSMYTTVVIWCAWAPIYFGSNHRMLCMSLCTSLSAFVILIILFFPKLYIILLEPEKNDRSHFTTCKILRCHVGSTMKWNSNKTQSALEALPRSPLYEGPMASINAIFMPESPEHISVWRRLTHALITKQDSQISLRQGPQKPSLKRDPSIWSDVSGSAVTAATVSAIQQTREGILQKAYGSQIDLSMVEKRIAIASDVSTTSLSEELELSKSKRHEKELSSPLPVQSDQRKNECEHEYRHGL